MLILFQISSLQAGGAERQLIVLANALARRHNDIHVAVYNDGGSLVRDLDQSVLLHYIGRKGRLDFFGFYWRLILLTKRLKPDIVHGYLPMANILTLISSRLFSRARIVWGVRASYVDLSHYGLLYRLISFSERVLSNYVDTIICNSKSGKRYAEAQGFPSRKIKVIPNGIDVDKFSPNILHRRKIREEWNIDEDQFLIGIVGRIDPMKDFETFLRAVAIISNQQANIRFVCVGGSSYNNIYDSSMKQLSSSLGLDEKVLWSPSRLDIEYVYNGLDLLVSSSYGESFPNVVAESMACGTPCIVTDVGDSAHIVGDCGTVVPPKDIKALVRAMLENYDIKQEDRVERSIAVRQRIVDLFSIKRLVGTTELIFAELLRQ